AALRWKIAELYWNQGSLEDAQTTIIDLQSRFHQAEAIDKSWFMLGKIYFLNKNYSAARNAFLRYAVLVPSASDQGYQVQMWTALIDYEEKRFVQALQTLNHIMRKKSSLITQQESIYARYILLLDIQNQSKSALKHAKRFNKKHKQSLHAAEIRLLHADLLADLPNMKTATIIKAYGILAESEADTVIGRKAFMRKMMANVQHKTTYRNLKPVIIALKRIANQNQLSEIEDEAFLHEAILWERLAAFDSAHSPRGAAEAALEQFTQASSSVNPRLAKQAKKQGKVALKRQMKTLIKQKRWLPTVSLWERFPNFRPPDNEAAKLRFDVAHGLRLLMEYEQADSILQQLHSLADGSVWGEKVMLERARLWHDKADPQGVNKVMRWLDKHEYTLYRPEMLVLVARMQLQNKDAVAAAHTLKFVLPEDIAPDAQAEYWQVVARSAESLSRWHTAARAWRFYAQQDVDDAEKAKLNQAHALFKGHDFLPAEALYSKTPKSLITPVWQYRYSMCQLKSGKWNQALERLEKLKYNPDAGIYASMAALTLAEREGDRLLEENP
ncbi:MAG: hypothetical protein Q9M19_01950, partial [Mariprofundaceae bacterium]|nr:hypothetical protein [Mariprofundaceae bacterium]